MKIVTKKLIKPVVKSFNCTSCGAVLSITVLGVSVTVSCPSCLSLIDANDPNLRILQKATSKLKVLPLIPIGKKGKLSGKVFQCVGFLQKYDGAYSWTEYLLFNPYHGFRWLVENDAHWTLFKRTHRTKETLNFTLNYKGRPFRLFNQGQGQIAYVEGEFYWRVKIGDTSHVNDYINPPYMVSVDKTDDEKIYTLGSYIEKERVEQAFGINDLPSPRGVSACQPSPHKGNLKKIGTIFFPSLMVCLAILSLRNLFAAKEEVFNRQIPITLESVSRSAYSGSTGKYDLIKTAPFQIDRNNKNLEVNVFAGLSNAWLYLDILLVDNKSGKGIPLPISLEYYWGSDYKEGSKNESEIFSNIPRGEYYLSIQPQAGGNFAAGLLANIILKSDVPRNSNFLWVLLFMATPFIFIGWRSRSFEVQRWENGSENPYIQFEGDE